MPLIESLITGRRTIPVRFEGGSISITYDRKGYNGSFLSAQATRTTYETIVDVVLDWDLERETAEGKTEKWPITREAVEDVPAFIVNSIAQAIAEDQRPNARAATDSTTP